MIRATGAFDAMLGRLLEVVGTRPHLLIGGGMFAFAAASGTIGMAEEYIPFVAILISLCVAMRMDAITAMGIMICGYGIGYGVAAINPFTVLIAQDVAGLPPTSGWQFRLVLLPIFVAIGIHHVWRYARRVAADPANSLVADIPEAQHAKAAEYPAMTAAHVLILLVLLALSRTGGFGRATAAIGRKLQQRGQEGRAELPCIEPGSRRNKDQMARSVLPNRHLHPEDSLRPGGPQHRTERDRSDAGTLTLG